MFKEDFKYYKSRQPVPDLNGVLDFKRDYCLIKDKVRYTENCFNCDSEPLWGLKPINQWKAYELVDNPGLIFIRNPFTSKGQRYWIIRCLRDYTRKPNKLNLDVHKLVSEKDEWWQMCQQDVNQNIVNKLRWATLGYHHNWDTKIYSEDSKGEFPQDLACLSRYVAGTLNFRNFNAEAAIVNFYHMNSTLSGHTDHSEQFLEAPLFSFSFGQSAIFLLGGKTLDIKPTALFIDSGDIIIMSKQSRLCYHGVPKILGAPHSCWKEVDIETDNSNAICRDMNSETIEQCKDEKFWKPFEKYIENSRININIRQVLRRGEKRLHS